MEHPVLMARLREALRFSTFEEAAGSIHCIHALYLQCLEECDSAGAELCRRRLREGKRRSGMLSRNPRLNPEKRARQTEISLWFLMWLENPAIFPEWLELRRQTASYRQLTGAGPEREDGDAGQ